MNNADQRNEKLRLLNEAYQNLKSDPDSWKEELEEREELEGAIADGLEEETDTCRDVN